MFCEKKSHTKMFLMIAAAAVLAAGVSAFLMGGSKKGRKLTRKARHIGREVESLIRDELSR